MFDSFSKEEFLFKNCKFVNNKKSDVVERSPAKSSSKSPTNTLQNEQDNNNITDTDTIETSSAYHTPVKARKTPPSSPLLFTRASPVHGLLQ